MEGKSGMAAMPILMQTQKKLREQGLEFTSEETDLLMTILTKDMTEEEAEEIMRKVWGV